MSNLEIVECYKSLESEHVTEALHFVLSYLLQHPEICQITLVQNRDNGTQEALTIGSNNLLYGACIDFDYFLKSCLSEKWTHTDDNWIAAALFDVATFVAGHEDYDYKGQSIKSISMNLDQYHLFDEAEIVLIDPKYIPRQRLH